MIHYHNNMVVQPIISSKPFHFRGDEFVSAREEQQQQFDLREGSRESDTNYLSELNEESRISPIYDHKTQPMQHKFHPQQQQNSNDDLMYVYSQLNPNNNSPDNSKGAAD